MLYQNICSTDDYPGLLLFIEGPKSEGRIVKIAIVLSSLCVLRYRAFIIELFDFSNVLPTKSCSFKQFFSRSCIVQSYS